MKKTLRKKFIFFAMSVVTVLLVVLIGAITGFSWAVLDRQSDDILHMLAGSDEEDPFVELREPKPFAPPMNMDTIKSARFFTVHIDQNGEILDINVDQISSVSTEIAAEYAARITEASGKIDGYK